MQQAVIGMRKEELEGRKELGVIPETYKTTEVSIWVVFGMNKHSHSSQLIALNSTTPVLLVVTAIICQVLLAWKEEKKRCMEYFGTMLTSCNAQAMSKLKAEGTKGG